MKFKYILISILLISVSFIFGQEKNHRDFDLRRDQLENLRIWKMTEFLELTPEQSEKFFPKLRMHDNSIKELKNSQKDKIKTVHQQIREDKNYSFESGEIKKIVHDISSVEIQIIKKNEEFILSLNNILTSGQIIKYMIFEQRFRGHLINEMKSRRTMQDKAMRKKPY